MDDLRQRSATALISGCVFLGAYFVSAFLFILLMLGILGWVLYDEWPRVLGFSHRSKRYWSISLVYPITPFLALISLVFWYRSLSYFLPLYPFIASWVVDTGAYLAGKRFGEHKLWPEVSPGKTWEGLGGGLFSLFVFHLMVAVSLHMHIGLFRVVTSTVVVGFFAVGGDLFISWMKRRRGIKDTGDVLPGHGGILDRFDSVLSISLGLTLFSLMQLV